MLVVTTTVRVIDGVHSNTTSTGPRVPLDLELVMSTTSLEQRFVDTSTTSYDTDSSTRSGRNGLLGTGRKTNTGSLTVGIVTNDGSVVTRGTSKGTTVTRLLLDVANDGTFGKGGEGKNVGNVQSGLLTAVDKLAGGKTLGSNKGLDTGAVLVRVTESDLGEGSATVRGGSKKCMNVEQKSVCCALEKDEGRTSCEVYSFQRTAAQQHL